MKVLIDVQELYSENVRLVKSLMKRESAEEYSEKLKWALQMLYFDGSDWEEICRIDNYPHEIPPCSHIHFYRSDRIKKVRLTFHEAEKLIKEISKRILKEKFKENIEFE